MLYNFLYVDNPANQILTILIVGLGVIVFLTISLFTYQSKTLTSYISCLIAFAFLISFTFNLNDYLTTPSEYTKTTDLYQITKEKDFLTFTAKKPYNHLYKTKTMKITYTNSSEYVIVIGNQAYKIPKESVKNN